MDIYTEKEKEKYSFLEKKMKSEKKRKLRETKSAK